MAGFFGGNMKRKDFYDEHFSFSSPATKIRRLDVELMPVVEGDEVAAAMEFDQQLSTAQLVKHGTGIECLGYATPECSTSVQRALVAYKPTNCSVVLSSSNENVPFKLSSDLIGVIKNYGSKVGDQSVTRMDDKIPVYNNNLALVPWVPSQILGSPSGCDQHTECLEALMDHEEAEAASMEVDEYMEQVLTKGQAGEGFQQWQQHCLTPQVLPIGSAAIMWSA